MELRYNAFSKEQLKNILNLDLKKSELLEIFMKKLQDDKDFRIECYKKFPREFALTPSQFCEITGMTHYQRKKWKSKIPVVYKETITKWNQEITFNMYNRNFAENIYSPELLKQWEESVIKQPRKINTEKAKATRETHKEIFKQHNDSFKAMVQSWSNISEECRLIFELAYWTHWLSRWAKTKQLSSHKKSKMKSQELYKLKNEAIKYMYRSQFATLSFYESENPHKVSFNLCPHHYEMYYDYDGSYRNIMDFYHEHRDVIKQCKYCYVNEISYYYSLFYLEIKHPNIQEIYSFHTPYPIGKDFLPNKDTLPQINHIEQEGIFRFGREVYEDEKLTHSEKKVINNFNKSLEKVKNLLN